MMTKRTNEAASQLRSGHHTQRHFLPRLAVWRATIINCTFSRTYHGDLSLFMRMDEKKV